MHLTLSEDAYCLAKSPIKYQGTQTLTNLKTTQLELQAVLDKDNKFDVILPQQTITDGNIIFWTNSRNQSQKASFFIKASKGYSEENNSATTIFGNKEKCMKMVVQWFDCVNNMAKSRLGYPCTTRTKP